MAATFSYKDPSIMKLRIGNIEAY